MTHFTLSENNAWLERQKLAESALEVELEAQVSEFVLMRVAVAYDVSGWVDENSTPRMVRSIIAMYYASYVIDRTYSTDEATVDPYSRMLRNRCDTMLDAIASGKYDILGADADAMGISEPAFYPTDASSDPLTAPLLVASGADPSAGPPAFTMGDIW